MLVECKQCGDEINKDQCDISRTKNNFCTHSCAAKFNNKKYPKRSIDLTQTLLEFKTSYSNWRYKIGQHARYHYLKQFEDHCCTECSYKHIQVAHIKAVSKFDDDTTLAEINAIENLVGLCPNCHWEYDSGLLILN